MTAPEPKGKFEWQRLVLTLDIPLATKAVALVLSVYASRDGSNCHPGNRRLAWALCADKKTIRRHLAVLRDELRLIERTFYGQQAGRRGLSDCYQLVVPWDLAARVKIREYEPELGTPVSPHQVVHTRYVFHQPPIRSSIIVLQSTVPWKAAARRQIKTFIAAATGRKITGRPSWPGSPHGRPARNPARCHKTRPGM